MADFSYTVYLMHVPLLVLITAILSSNFGVQFVVAPTPWLFLILAVIVLVIYVALYLFSLITERFTPNVKAFLAGMILPSRLKLRTESR
jgi:peptidoglycan/LPS O-acetylase OafA/YrhL